MIKAGFLKSVLEHVPDDYNVMLLVRSDNKSIGGARPAVGIRHASMGFDWEHGRFLLSTEEPVKKVDK